MSKTYEVSLDTIRGGAAHELFDRELKRILKNIRDPNTKATAKRTVTLKVTFEPNEQRTGITTSLDCKAKLAPVRTLQDHVHVGERGGEEILVGYDPNQPSLFPEDQDPEVQPPRPTADQVAANQEPNKEE